MSIPNIHQKYLQSEIDFLIHILTRNGHNRNTLIKITTQYLRNISNQNATIKLIKQH